jgi:hypothetical protein
VAAVVHAFETADETESEVPKMQKTLDLQAFSDWKDREEFACVDARNTSGMKVFGDLQRRAERSVVHQRLQLHGSSESTSIDVALAGARRAQCRRRRPARSAIAPGPR